MKRIKDLFMLGSINTICLLIIYLTQLQPTKTYTCFQRMSWAQYGDCYWNMYCAQDTGGQFYGCSNNGVPKWHAGY